MTRAVVGQYDRTLGRVRTHTDDFYDHRKLVLERISAALCQEKAQTQKIRKRKKES